jgi:predicted dehydrogenase
MPKFADVVVITTPDQQHMEPAIVFANLGYHILVESNI